MLLTQEEAKQKGEKVLGRMENWYRPEEIALNHMWFLTAFRNQRYWITQYMSDHETVPVTNRKAVMSFFPGRVAIHYTVYSWSDPLKVWGGSLTSTCGYQSRSQDVTTIQSQWKISKKARKIRPKRKASRYSSPFFLPHLIHLSCTLSPCLLPSLSLRVPVGAQCLFNAVSPWLPVCHTEVMSLIINFITLQPRRMHAKDQLWHFAETIEGRYTCRH